MEYEILNQMIDELEQEGYSLKNINEDIVWAKFLTILGQIKTLCTLQSRIAKQSEVKMEYETLLEMIEELKHKAYETMTTGKEFDTYTDQIRILSQLRMRIDKARESDIIAMSNEGCI
jgi:hypothetical protein